MKVLHIIPSAFNYFNDIRDQAFKLVEELGTFGVISDTVAIQYGTAVTKDTAAAIRSAAPSHSDMHLAAAQDVVESLEGYDIIHVHCPILGEMRRIIEWKRSHPAIPLVVTYYRPVTLTDLFSSVVMCYNAYYLRALFKVADIITYPSYQKEARRYEKKLREGVPSVVVDSSPVFLDTDLTQDSDTVQLRESERLAWKYAFIYQKLTEQT